ncbi:MAG TPA: TerB family tellurite resistance protein [Pirellulaceae bacterium]|nr:TerB family tellurite resistance protein [Pirellulaceae bacterium]
MSQFHQFIEKIQADGKIGDQEVQQIREEIAADGQLDIADVKLLVELYCGAKERSPQFDDLFFEVLETVFLSDGRISSSEEFYLLKMLYSDREITEREREFLRRVRKQLPERAASFESLFETAINAPNTNWCVGGR